MVADALAVMDAAELSDAHVLGVSMGGMIAQGLAIERPRARALADPRLHDAAGARRTAAVAAAGRRGGARLLPDTSRRRCSCRRSTPSARATRRRSGSREDLAMRGRDADRRRRRSSRRWPPSPATTGARGSSELGALPVTVIHGSEDALVAGRARPRARGADPRRRARRGPALRPPAADRRPGRRAARDRRALRGGRRARRLSYRHERRVPGANANLRQPLDEASMNTRYTDYQSQRTATSGLRLVFNARDAPTPSDHVPWP